MSIFVPFDEKPIRTSTLFFISALFLIIIWRQAGDFWGAMGSDAALWGLTARDLNSGLQSNVPPGYPTIVALVQAGGVALVPAGWAVSSLCAATLPVVIFWLAHTLGASALASTAAAIGTCLHPMIFEWAHQMQPDALSALLIALLALWCQHAHRRWWVAGLGGTLLLFREHGLALWPAWPSSCGVEEPTSRSEWAPWCYFSQWDG